MDQGFGLDTQTGSGPSARARARSPGLNMLSDFYAAIVRRRRERYARRPDLRLRLRRPVISVGNLAVGGRGKTPMVAAIARELLAMGERPSILTRGYARADAEDGVVVVRDPDGIRADLRRAGDEPLMLARSLPGASVLVCPNRYLAGRLAEHQLDASVHILDDGFQHLQLDRDVDIVMLGKDDVAHPITLPGGRLREPLDTLVAADAIVTADDVVVEGAGWDVPVFRTRRALTNPCPGVAAAALAGIADPARFFDDVRGLGITLVATLAFRDHHAYSRRDLERICADARSAGAGVVLTTEKDYVRLLPFRPFAIPIASVALTMEPDPLPEFRQFLAGSLRAARDIVG
jgi:tetraacyldisaccharide 4'-kinase